MAGKAGMTSTLPMTLPARYEAGFPWRLDRRCKAVREMAADLVTLWQDLGGMGTLSTQERALCERVVYLRRRIIAHETAVMRDQKPLMTHGEHANCCNTLVGLLKTLGLERRALNVGTLKDYIGAA